MVILSCDGPVIDACVLAAVSALKNGRYHNIKHYYYYCFFFIATLPSVEIESEKPLVSMATRNHLKTGQYPLMTSFTIHKK